MCVTDLFPTKLPKMRQLHGTQDLRPKRAGDDCCEVKGSPGTWLNGKASISSTATICGVREMRGSSVNLRFCCTPFGISRYRVGLSALSTTRVTITLIT